MSEQTTLRTRPSPSPHGVARRVATCAVLGALVITGPWTSPAAGHSAGNEIGRPAVPLSALVPADDAPGPYAYPNPYQNPHTLGVHGIDGEDFFTTPIWSALLAASRALPVVDFPISAAYGIPGSWAAGHHTGVDFATPTGTTVRSAGPGTVVLAGYAGDYGNAVIVRMTDGYYALYAHLSEISVEYNEWIETGEEIGKSGDTGNSTGPHLHFEIRTGPTYGTDVDPLAYLADHGVSVI